MHQAKLNVAFKNLPKIFFNQPEIRIIDYGCGQGIGTMCYSDFLETNGYAQEVKSVTLIEPSKISLQRAALHTSHFFPETDITTINKRFDELTTDDLSCGEKIPTLHILSNVLDLMEFYLEDLAELIHGNLTGYDLFVCVGPYEIHIADSVFDHTVYRIITCTTDTDNYYLSKPVCIRIRNFDNVSHYISLRFV